MQLRAQLAATEAAKALAPPPPPEASSLPPSSASVSRLVSERSAAEAAQYGVAASTRAWIRACGAAYPLEPHADAPAQVRAALSAAAQPSCAVSASETERALGDDASSATPFPHRGSNSEPAEHPYACIDLEKA